MVAMYKQLPLSFLNPDAPCSFYLFTHIHVQYFSFVVQTFITDPAFALFLMGKEKCMYKESPIATQSPA